MPNLYSAKVNLVSPVRYRLEPLTRINQLEPCCVCVSVASSGRSGVMDCASTSNMGPWSSESPLIDIFISWSIPLKRMVVFLCPLPLGHNPVKSHPRGIIYL